MLSSSYYFAFAISSWILFIFLEVFRNFYIVKVKKSSPFYTESLIIRAIASILHGVLLDSVSWKDYFFLLLFQVSSFYVLFDILLNTFLLRKPFLFYLGKNSFIDRTLSKIPLWGLIIIKIIFLALSVFSFISYVKIVGNIKF